MSIREQGNRREMPVEKPVSLINIFNSFGLISPEASPQIQKEVSVEDLLSQLTNPKIAIELGASDSAVKTIRDIALTAKLIDEYSETGKLGFLQKADDVYTQATMSLPKDVRKTVLERSKAAVTYFFFEQAVARRIKREDNFLEEEAIEYLLRRGEDSVIYAEVLAKDGITHPSLIAGFRSRQALWDLADDVEDLEEDKKTIGANVLLLCSRGNLQILRRMSDSLFYQSKTLDMPKPLEKAIEEQYEATRALLN